MQQSHSIARLCHVPRCYFWIYWEVWMLHLTTCATAVHAAAIKGVELKHLQMTALGTLVVLRGQRREKQTKAKAKISHCFNQSSAEFECLMRGWWCKPASPYSPVALWWSMSSKAIHAGQHGESKHKESSVWKTFSWLANSGESKEVGGSTTEPDFKDSGEESEGKHTLISLCGGAWLLPDLRLQKASVAQPRIYSILNFSTWAQDISSCPCGTFPLGSCL